MYSWEFIRHIVIITHLFTGVANMEEPMESDDKESKGVDDSGKVDNQEDTTSLGKKKSNDISKELPNQDQETQKQNDHGLVPDDQGGSLEGESSDQNIINVQENQSHVDQNGLKTSLTNDCEDDNNQGGDQNESVLKEASGSSQKLPQEGSSVNPEKNVINQTSEKTNQCDQRENDHKTEEATSQQIDQSTNTENVSPNQDKVTADQDKVKTNQDEVKGPSTPPYTKSTSCESQDTEIIGSDGSRNSHESGSEGDDEYQAPTGQSDQDKQHSSEDEEQQYGRPWLMGGATSSTVVST